MSNLTIEFCNRICVLVFVLLSPLGVAVAKSPAKGPAPLVASQPSAPVHAPAVAPSNVPAGGMTENVTDSMLNGSIYKANDRSKPLFTSATIVRVEGERRQVERTYFDPKGEKQAVEIADLGSGGHTLLNYRFQQFQTGAEGTIQRQGDKLQFKFTEGGKTKTGEDKWGEDVVAAPSLIPYLQANWSKLMSGETVKARFAVVERTETIPFEYKKSGETETAGRKGIVITMKPQSMLISIIVGTIKLVFTPDGRRLLEYDGRAFVKIKDGDKWKDFDAVTIYH
jgi:hypothetical protein